MKRKLMLISALLCLSCNASANLISYTISGILEDSTGSNTTLFGGDGNTFDTVDDGSQFTLMFDLPANAAPDYQEFQGPFTSYEYYGVENVMFLVNGNEHAVENLNAAFKDTSYDWNLLRLNLSFSIDAFFGLTSIGIDSYGTDLFVGDLQTPTLINSENHDTLIAGGSPVYYARTLSIASNQIPEPASILLLTPALFMLTRRKKSIT